MRFKDKLASSIDPKYYDALSYVESSNDPNAQAPTSSAAGLFQFLKGTWKDEVKRLNLDYTQEDRFNPTKARKVVEGFTKRNEKYLQNKLNRKVSSGELYLAHFLGMGGASTLLDAYDKNPNASIADVVTPAALKANKWVFYNENGSVKKVKDIYNWAGKKMGQKVPTQQQAGRLDYGTAKEAPSQPSPQPQQRPQPPERTGHGLEEAPNRQVLTQEQVDLVSRINAPSAQAPVSIDEYEEPEVVEEEVESVQEEQAAPVSKTPIIDEAMARINASTARMAQFQQMMKANQVQYIDSNDQGQQPVQQQNGTNAVATYQTGGTVIAQSGREVKPIPSILDQFTDYGIEEPKPEPTVSQEPVKLMPTPKRRGRTPVADERQQLIEQQQQNRTPMVQGNNPALETVTPSPQFPQTEEEYNKLMEEVESGESYNLKKFEEEIGEKADYLNPMGLDKIDIGQLTDEAEITALQGQLLDNGYYLGDTGADGIMGSKTRAAIGKFNDSLSLNSELTMGDFKTPDQIKNLQKFLSDKGLDINPDGKFANGGIDGKLGDTTAQALRDYNSKTFTDALKYKSIKSGTGELGECEEKQCSEYMQNEIWRRVNPGESRTEWNKRTGLHGNAWEIGQNIINAGGRKISSSGIAPGDVVTMYTGNAPTEGSYQQRANRNGSGTTHTGVIDQVNPDGTYWILHNVHKVNDAGDDYIGREFRTKVNPNGREEHFGFDVRGIFRANTDGMEGKAKPLRKDTKLALNPRGQENLAGIGTIRGTAEERIQEFVEPLNNFENKEKFSQIFGLEEAEYQALAQLTIGIIGQESTFGTSLFQLAKEPAAHISRFYDKMTDGNFDKLKSDEVSKGVGQLKYDTNFHSDLSEFGITKENFSDEENAPITSLYKVATDYRKYRKKGYSQKDAIYRAAVVYNASLEGESGGKKREEWAKDYDVDYANKAINFAASLSVQEGDKKYKTLIDELAVEDNVYKWNVESR